MAERYPFLKGHGTENDFVLLPDHDGRIHGDLDPDRVRALCDRRAGIGADGVIRVIRTAAGTGADSGAQWFMDYRNSDGSVSEMCGNGVRVFALHLLQEGLVTPDDGGEIPIWTRDGLKTAWLEDDGDLTVLMGPIRVLGDTEVVVDGRTWPAVHVDMGNPHAVVMVDDLDQAGSLEVEPSYDAALFPEGVNIEFVTRDDPADPMDRGLRMRVHERGSGETRSCGTGACAVQAAVATADDARLGGGGLDGAPITYSVDVPGGHLTVSRDDLGQMLLSGPAAIVARGETTL